MPTTPTPPLDHEAVTAEVLLRISERAPGLEALAAEHLARLTPDRWTIEWHLPTWLGRRLELEPRLSDALTRSNVFGLLSVRLEDDLEDGDVPPHLLADARALARLAYASAVAGYVPWFDAGSPLWSFLAKSMAEWRAGADGADLATRGAPVKIAAYASCLHAGRLDLWLPLERSLDSAVTALVLYDQFWDWEIDLAADRWNGFVAAVVGREQAPGRRDRNRAAVLTAMLTRDVVRQHLDAAVSAARDGASLAANLGITELGEFLTSWADLTSKQGAQVARHYRHAGDRAASLLLGTTVGGAAS